MFNVKGLTFLKTVHQFQTNELVKIPAIPNKYLIST